MKPIKVLERDIQKGVIDALAVWGFNPQRRNIRNDPVTDRNGNIRYTKSGKPLHARSEHSGMPDVTATVPGLGTRLEVEVKRPGNRPTKLQYQRIEECNRMGGVAVWVDSIEWIIEAIPYLLRGAKATLTFELRSQLYWPKDGVAERVAWAVNLTTEEHETCRAFIESIRTSSQPPRT